MTRMPKIGDLIVEKRGDERYMGLVRDIIEGSYGHLRNVLIEWSTISPPGYNTTHGYHGTNIHNCRNRFDVIRNGVKIP